MDDDRYFEIREQLVSVIRAFIDECEKNDIDYQDDIYTIIADIESS